jgi:flagellar M-ring protein FliF
VVIDDAVEFQMQNGERIAVKRKRNPDELRMITELAQAAIGFDSSRGDTVSVQNLSFDRPDGSDLPADTWTEKIKRGVNDSSSLIRFAGLAIILVGIYFIVLRPIQKKVMETPVPATQASLAMAEARQVAALSSSDGSSSAGQRSIALKSELVEYVQAEPEASTAAIRAWLREGEG